MLSVNIVRQGREEKKKAHPNSLSYAPHFFTALIDFFYIYFFYSVHPHPKMPLSPFPLSSSPYSASSSFTSPYLPSLSCPMWKCSFQPFTHLDFFFHSPFVLLFAFSFYLRAKHFLELVSYFHLIVLVADGRRVRTPVEFNRLFNWGTLSLDIENFIDPCHLKKEDHKI